MSQEEKIAIMKSCVGMLSALSRQIQQKAEYAKDGIRENNSNQIIGTLCGIEQLGTRIKSIYDTMVFIHRL